MIDVGSHRYFAYDECPIVSQLDIRLELAREYPEYGFQYDHCGCDKVDDEFFYCGYCEDAWVDKPHIKKSGARKTGRAYRRDMRAQKLQYYKDTAKTGSMHVLSLGFDRTGIEYCGRAFWMLDIEDDLEYAYVRRPKNSKYKRFYKNYSNRIIRRKNLVLPKGNQHYKYFDYWWAID